MNQEQLQAIRERVNKATPGPWKWEPGEHLALGRIAGEYTICQFGGGRHWDEWKGVEPDEEDAEFIAHAREDLPNALDHIEHLTDDLHAETEKSFWQAKEIERLGEALDKQIALSEELAKQRDRWMYTYITRPTERDAEIERLRGALEYIKDTCLDEHVADVFARGLCGERARQALAGEST